MSENRLSNLGKDLTKAKQQALLIEVLQSDLDSWADQSPDVFRTVCDASAAVFDAEVKGGKTNVLMVSEAQGQEQLSIFGGLLGSLDNEFDDLHKREILKRLTGFGLNQVLGGMVGEAVGDSLSVGAGQMMEYLAEWNDSAPDFLASAFESGVEGVADESGEIVGDIGGTGAEAITGQFSSGDSIYLSQAARKRLKELAPRLSDKATSHETLQLALEMLLVTALGAPKVIVVKDPLRLDDASLALLAMLVSLEKDLRQANHTENPEEGMAQTASISVVLTFTGSQPNDTVENKSIAQKQQAISRLRMMASRYSLLERLDSDIPVPAVRASTFVGRDQELESLRQQWNRLCEQQDIAAKQTWCLIKGEPGTGKTALANRVIQQIRSDAGKPASFRIPTLRMLNQTGHSAQATGLASLKNSMADELRRLALIYQENVGWFTRSGQQITEGVQRWKDDATSDDPEAKKRMQGRVGKVVSKLLGVDAAIGFAGSVKDWSKQEEMRSMREQEFGQSSQANHKEEQFELLREALLEIRKLADKCTPDLESQSTANAFPVLLLIDDLQWVDDFTAEFLLNEWPADMPVYILATARGSDSFTTTGESSKYQSLNHHRNRLFSELGLIDAGSVRVDRESGEEQEKEGEDKRDLSLVSRLELKGMDRPMLASLIKLTYAGITEEQAEQFAAGVIKNLSGANSASEVVTLFAIETLNVISDPQFYHRNPELPRLIEPLPNSDRYGFKDPQNADLTEILDQLFKTLTDTYQASYLMETKNFAANGRFKLASYAVLEERLHLIQQYFGEYGGSAKYSLLFSALMGSAFNRGLVQQVLEVLGRLSPDECSGLAPFLTELQAQSTGYLNPSHYELLERAYEVIRRLEENTPKYVHQHSLLRQFLQGQLTQMLERTAPEGFENAIAELVDRVRTIGLKWFSGEFTPPHNKPKMAMDLNLERGWFLEALSRYWYEQMQHRSSELGEWAEDYADTLIDMAISLRSVGRLEESLSRIEEALPIGRRGYELAPERWDESFAITLNHQGTTLKRLGRPKQAQMRFEEALFIWREGYKSEPARWYDGYKICLTELASIYEEVGLSEGARTLLEETQSLLEEVLCMFENTGSGYEKGLVSIPRNRALEYKLNLASLARIHKKLGSVEDAAVFFERGLSIAKVIFDPKKKHLASLYTSSLTDLADMYEKLNRQHEALPLYEEAVSVERRYFDSAPEMRGRRLIYTLNDLADIYAKMGREDEALPLYEEALLIGQQIYDALSESGPENFALMLSRLANIHEKLNRPEKALPLYREILSIHRQGYHSSPEQWAAHFELKLTRVAGIYSQLGLLGEAVPLYEEAISITRRDFKSSPERFSVELVNRLADLAGLYEKLGRREDALTLYEEILAIDSQGYDKECEVGSERRACKLGFLARIHENLDRLEEAQALLEEELVIRRKGFELEPQRCAYGYVNCLGNLAINMEKNQNFPGALEYCRKSKEFALDYSSLLSETALGYRIMSSLRSAGLLKKLERYSDAIEELDSSNTVLLEMDQRQRSERYIGRFLSLCLRAEILVRLFDLEGAKALVPILEKLVNDHGLGQAARSRLDVIRTEIENAGKSKE